MPRVHVYVSYRASQLNIAPGGIWMGLNYTLATKTYQWVDGTELIPDSDWTLWAPGQPIVADKDKCVLLEKTYVIKKRFGWSLVDCDDPDTTGVALCVVDQGKGGEVLREKESMIRTGL